MKLRGVIRCTPGAPAGGGKAPLVYEKHEEEREVQQRC